MCGACAVQHIMCSRKRAKPTPTMLATSRRSDVRIDMEVRAVQQTGKSLSASLRPHDAFGEYAPHGPSHRPSASPTGHRSSSHPMFQNYSVSGRCFRMTPLCPCKNFFVGEELFSISASLLSTIAATESAFVRPPTSQHFRARCGQLVDRSTAAACLLMTSTRSNDR